MNVKAREVKRLHREAMEFVDESFIVQLEGNRDQFLHLTRLAFEKEVAAADLMVDEEEIEPTRSVLHRGAATLAYRCEMYEEAKRLVYRALAGMPPPDIEEELNDLLGNVKLALSGWQLGKHELQMSLEGDEVGHGLVSIKELTSRATTIHGLVQIAVKSGIRRMENFTQDMLNNVKEVAPYIVGVSPGSFNVSLRFGTPLQNELPGFEEFDEIIEPFLENLRLFDQGEYDALEKNIVDPGDYRDFVNAAKELAPDGDRISSVKFQARVGGQLKIVTFNRIQKELSEVPLPDVPETSVTFQATDKTISKTGVLMLADGYETECELVTQDDGKWVIEGHEITIDTIARAYYKKTVLVKGKRMKKTNLVNRIWLESEEDIRPLNDVDDHNSANASALTFF